MIPGRDSEDPGTRPFYGNLNDRTQAFMKAFPSAARNTNHLRAHLAHSSGPEAAAIRRPANMPAVHKLHTRTAFDDRAFRKTCGSSSSNHWSKTCFDVEHAEHTAQPQQRQWCVRSSIPKPLEQTMQLLASSAGIQRGLARAAS